jgi:hypothetical protein
MTTEQKIIRAKIVLLDGVRPKTPGERSDMIAVTYPARFGVASSS